MVQSSGYKIQDKPKTEDKHQILKWVYFDLIAIEVARRMKRSQSIIHKRLQDTLFWLLVATDVMVGDPDVEIGMELRITIASGTRNSLFSDSFLNFKCQGLFPCSLYFSAPEFLLFFLLLLE